jgi:hypothetical protein
MKSTKPHGITGRERVKSAEVPRKIFGYKEGGRNRIMKKTAQ